MMADPEAEAREVIDAQLGAAGWRVREARSKGGAAEGMEEDTVSLNDFAA